jgi:hypothetical protein
VRAATLKSWSLVLHGTVVPPTASYLNEVFMRLSSERGLPRRAAGDHHGNGYYVSFASRTVPVVDSAFIAILCHCSLLASGVLTSHVFST